MQERRTLFFIAFLWYKVRQIRMTDSIYINFKYWYAYFQEGLILDLFYLFSQRFNNIKTKLKYL